MESCTVPCLCSRERKLCGQPEAEISRFFDAVVQVLVSRLAERTRKSRTVPAARKELDHG